MNKIIVIIVLVLYKIAKRFNKLQINNVGINVIHKKQNYLSDVKIV